MQWLWLVLAIWIGCGLGSVLFNVWVARRNHQRLQYRRLLIASLVLGPIAFIFFVGAFIYFKLRESHTPKGTCACCGTKADNTNPMSPNTPFECERCNITVCGMCAFRAAEARGANLPACPHCGKRVLRPGTLQL